MLVLARRIEVLKDHQENEEIIHAQRFLDDVTCQKFERLLLSPAEENTQIENHRQRDPNHAPDRGFLDGDSVSFAVKDAEIEGKHAQDKDIKGDPKK